MTFFEMEQIADFMHSLERHLDDWVFNNRQMRMMLAELSRIEKKLQTATVFSKNKAHNPDFSELLCELQERTEVCRCNIQERLMK